MVKPGEKTVMSDDHLLLSQVGKSRADDVVTMAPAVGSSASGGGDDGGRLSPASSAPSADAQVGATPPPTSSPASAAQATAPTPLPRRKKPRVKRRYGHFFGCKELACAACKDFFMARVKQERELAVRNPFAAGPGSLGLAAPMAPRGGREIPARNRAAHRRFVACLLCGMSRLKVGLGSGNRVRGGPSTRAYKAKAASTNTELRCSVCDLASPEFAEEYKRRLAANQSMLIVPYPMAPPRHGGRVHAPMGGSIAYSPIHLGHAYVSPRSGSSMSSQGDATMSVASNGSPHHHGLVQPYAPVDAAAAAAAWHQQHIAGFGGPTKRPSPSAYEHRAEQALKRQRAQQHQQGHHMNHHMNLHQHQHQQSHGAVPSTSGATTTTAASASASASASAPAWGVPGADMSNSVYFMRPQYYAAAPSGAPGAGGMRWAPQAGWTLANPTSSAAAGGAATAAAAAASFPPHSAGGGGDPRFMAPQAYLISNPSHAAGATTTMMPAPGSATAAGAPTASTGTTAVALDTTTTTSSWGWIRPPPLVTNPGSMPVPALAGHTHLLHAEAPGAAAWAAQRRSQPRGTGASVAWSLAGPGSGAHPINLVKSQPMAATTATMHTLAPASSTTTATPTSSGSTALATATSALTTGAGGAAGARAAPSMAASTGMMAMYAANMAPPTAFARGAMAWAPPQVPQLQHAHLARPTMAPGVPASGAAAAAAAAMWMGMAPSGAAPPAQ